MKPLWPGNHGAELPCILFSGRQANYFAELSCVDLSGRQEIRTAEPCRVVSQGAKSSEVNAKQEQMDEAAAANPPTRLLLVVHGIGQNLTGSNIAQGDPSCTRY